MQAILERAGVKWGEPFPQFVVAREKFVSWVEKGAVREEKEWNAARTEEMSCLAEQCLAHGSQWFAALREAGLHCEWWNLYSDYALEIYFANMEQAIKAASILAEKVGNLSLATIHRNRNSVNVVLRTGTKGATLRGLAKGLGLEPAQVLAIGDTYNDLDMVNGEHGLTGGAVGNEEEGIKEAVRASGGFVAERSYGAGIAEILAAALGL